MNKKMTILYEYHDNLYINLTNKCSCACEFCIRQTRDGMEDSESLWLEHEPSYEEVVDAFSKVDMKKYNEIIFCGFGEPTERIDMVVRVGRFIKENYGVPVRLNTNGQGNLINDEDITPLLEGVIDTVSISLNTPDAERYQEIVRSEFGAEAYPGVLEFAKKARKYIKNVIMTTVETTITRDEEARCQKICDEIGVRYRIRPYED